MYTASSSSFVGSQGVVPLPSMVKVNSEQSSMKTVNGDKNISIQDASSEPKHTGTCEKATDCMKQILAGAFGAGAVIVGSTLAWNAFRSAPLLNGMVQSLTLSFGAGLVSGVLSENKKESAQNAALLGVLFAFCEKLSADPRI